jgi:hypothetical protein
LLSDKNVRGLALGVLGGLKATEATPAILPLLRAEDSDSRSIAIRALGRLGLRDAVAPIARLLEDDAAEVRASAVEALGDLAPAEVVRKSGELLDDESAVVRLRVLPVLVAARAREAASAAAPLLQDPSSEVRREAARALCMLGRREAIPRILKDGANRLFLLNAIRNPEVWKRFEERKVGFGWTGSSQSALEWIAKECGLELEGSFGERRDRSDSFRVSRGHEAISMVSLVEMYVIGEQRMILESDRIRVLTYPEARKFWERWGREELKK